MINRHIKLIIIYTYNQNKRNENLIAYVIKMAHVDIEAKMFFFIFYLTNFNKDDNNNTFIYFINLIKGAKLC